MSEPIYKIGDVLEDIQAGDKYLIILHGFEGLMQREYKVIRYDIHKTFCFMWLPESLLIKVTKRLGNIDISLLLTGEEPKKKWEVTDEDLPDIIDSLEKAGMEVKVATDAAIDGLKVKCVGVDDNGFHITCTKEDIKQAQEVEKAWDKAADICDGYDALEAKVKKLTDECESLRNNLKDATEAYNRQTACHEAWKRGWTECLKTFKYYLGTDDDKDDWC